MGSKPDFTQKLLNDLRLRKERMAGAQTSDAFRGSSRDIFKQSNGAKTMQTIDQKNGSTHRDFSSSHTTTQQGVNQIVPYGGGHHSAQKGDISMAIAYSFDNGGNLKAFDLQSNAAMVNLLKQMGKRSMQQTSNMQKWQSTNQFPTLTHLHIDEVARGAQKLNQILKACTSGLNIEKGSVEVGNELWKGAMELEQSLKMLVSLQEASSNCIIKPQRKSRLKLLEEGEDCDDDSGITIVKQKQVERPVFSFDRPSKNTKGFVPTELQQKQLALKGDPATKPEKQGAMISKGSHRRSASCGPEFQPSQLISSTKSNKSSARLPGVIAKLMGLEEVPQNANVKPATDVRTWPKHRSGELVLTSHGKSRTAGLKANDNKDVKIQVNQNRIESTKMAIMTANTHGQQEEKAYTMTNVTDNYNYRTTLDPQRNTWKEERAGIRNCEKDTQEVIYKVNELQRQMIQHSGGEGTPTNTNMEARVSPIAQTQGVKHATETSQRTVERERKSSEVPRKMQAVSMRASNTNEAGDRVANKISVNQQKIKTDIQLQLEVLPTVEPQGKKLRTDNTSQRTVNKSQQRKKAAHQPKPNNFQTVTSHSKNMQKQQNAIQNNPEGRCAASNALFTNKQNYDPATESASTNSDFKEKSSTSLKSGQNGPLTDGETDSKDCGNLNIDTKSASIPRKNVEEETTAQRRKPNVTNVKANEIMAKTVKTSTKTVRRQKPLKPILHGQKPKKLEKLIVSGGATQPNDRTYKSTQATAEPRDSLKQEETQEAESEHMSTTNQPNRDESYSLQDELHPSNRSEFTTPTIPDSQQGQQFAADEDHESKPQTIATDGRKDGAHTSHNLLQEQQRHATKMKQEPLTEDQIHLKQKLIQSHLFLNTAEALFKLHIPIGILNYASDQINIDKDSNLILDCGYELLKKKGRRKEMSLYPNIGKVMKCTEVRSLDNLVRQMHEDFETLQSYGRSEKDEDDEVEYLLKMLERDIFYTAPDLNSMWDLGWKDMVFAYTDADEVIRDVEQSLLDELLGEIVADWF